MVERFRERPRILRDWWGIRSLQTAASPDALVPARRTLTIALIAALFMALAGPFGTWEEPLIERLGFWVLGIGGCGLAGLALERGLKVLGQLRDRPRARALAIVALLAAPAGLLASAAAAALQHAPINWPLYLQTLPQILLVGAGLVGLLHLAARRRESAASCSAAEDPTLGGLLPLRFSGARLLAMEAQDHYVRVHTDQGAGLVLMGFETALAKAAQLEGKRVHRSWWVARAAVVGVVRGDGRATLRLRGGAEAPVSRRYARLLRSAGWY